MPIYDMEERALGWFGISMGTSLAFERITNQGEFSEETDAPELNKMECIYVNLRTLIRNAMNAVESASQIYVDGKILAEAVSVDWEGIKNAVNESNPSCEMVLYLCTYEGINDELKDVNFRNYTTPKQLAYESAEKGAIEYFLDNYKDELTKFKTRPTGKKGCVMLTHLPLDLVSYQNFPSLTLLESHTGKLKERRHWNTKINVKKDGPIIPFNRAMLLIFGDGAMFSPQSIKARRLLLEISEKGKWNPLTTIAKIEQDVRLAHEPFLSEFIKRYK